MKTIGLLGGASWSSTPLFYNTINAMVNERLGAFHSADIIMLSLDYDPIKSHYPARGWDKIAPIMAERLQRLDAMGPDCIVICNNTLHKVYDMIAPTLRLKAPVIHLIDETAVEAQARGMKKLLLTGTQTTMEDGFISRKLEAAGFTVDIPAPGDRALIQSIQTPLSLGDLNPAFRGQFKDMFNRYGGYDGVILACTELPLAISDAETNGMPVLNTIDIGCRAAVKFAIS